MDLLPDVFWTSLYSGWLTIVEISRLDSAFCNRHKRSLFLDSAYNTYYGLRYPVNLPEKKTADAMTAWIFRKRVPMRGLRLAPSLLDETELITSYLEVCGRRLEWIILKEVSAETLQRNVNFSALCFETHCPNLKKFSTSNCKWDATVIKMVTSCRSLVDLFITGNFTSENIQGLVGTCSNLKKLIITTRRDIQESVLTALVASCPHLEFVDFRRCGSFTNAVIDTLRVSCPRLTSLSLSRANLTSTAVFMWLERSTHLRSLSLSSSTVASILSANMQCTLSLRELQLTYVTMSMPDLREMLVHSPALQKLTISPCTPFAKVFANISGLFNLCPQLQYLNGTPKKDFQLLSESEPLF